MNIKLFDPVKSLIGLVTALRQVIQKKLTVQTVNFLATLLIVTIAILSAQMFLALILLKVFGF